MFHKRSRIKQMDTVYKLNFASVDKASAQVQEFLRSLKVERSNAIRVRLSVEEALLRWIDHFPEETDFRLEMGLHWGRPFIVLKLWGSEYDPLEQTDSDLGIWAEDLLGAIGLIPIFRYINGCNILQIPLKRPHRNPGIVLLLCTLSGAVLGIAVNLLFSDVIRTNLTVMVLTPLQNAFIRLLNAVSAPVMFLSVLTTVCSVGGISATGRYSKSLVGRFLLYSTVFTILSVLLSRFAFVINTSAPSQLSEQQVAGVLDFFLEIIPGDIMSPFIQGDFTQLIVIALVLGNALLIGGAKVQSLVTIIEEANTAGLVIAEWISDLSPWFVAILTIIGIQNNTAHMLLGIWKPALLITLFSLSALFLKMLHVCLKYSVSMANLWAKMRRSFILSLKTFSVDSPYAENIKCCEKKLGISKQLTSYCLPVGLICFMPVSTIASMIFTLYSAECYQVPVSSVWMLMALFLAVMLAAAGPPTAGIGILTYTVMFSKLHIPAPALTIVLIGDILMGFVIYPVNQALLQLEMIFEADRLGLLNKKMLRSKA